MADEPIVNDPTPNADPTPSPDPTPQSFIDATGNFTEGWENHYLSEDTRGNARVAGGRVTSIQGLMDTVINSDKMISGDKILRPSDSFGDADWDAFHAAGGWNNQPIEIKAPDGLPDGLWNTDRATKFSEGFNALRLNPKQVAGLTEMYNADILQQLTDKNNNAETSMAELKAGLLSDWGNAYTQKEHLANFAVGKGTKGDADFQERLLHIKLADGTVLGAHPDFVRYNANLGGDFSGSGGIPNIEQDPTPNDIQSQINAIMNSDAFMKATHPEHVSTMNRLHELHAKKGKINKPV